MEIATDGIRLAYVRSSDCRPDPRAPETDKITVSDTVVVRVVATGEERTWTFPGAVYDSAARAVVSSVVWRDDRVFASVDGHLVTLDPDLTETPDSSAAPVIELADGDATNLGLIGARGDGTIVAVVMVGDVTTGENTATRVVLLDAATGKELRELARLEAWIRVDGDPSGDH